MNEPARSNPAIPALLAMLHREWTRFVRQPSRLIASVLTPLMMWVLVSSGLSGGMSMLTGSGAGASSASGVNYAAYSLPGMATLTVVFSAIFGAISLIEDRHSGFLQGVLVAPAPAWSWVGAKLLGGSLLATAQASILLPLVLIHSSGVTPLGFLLAIGGMFLIATFVGALALALAWRVDSVQGFHGVMNTLLMPMWLLSGGLFPLSTSSGWLRTLMLANPLTWGTAVVRGGLGAAADVPGGMPGAFAIALGVALAASIVALLSMSRR